MPYVPTRFSRRILDHVVLNLVDMPNHPLILGIFGVPGDGKSFQLRNVLEKAEVSITTISAANLESDRAGQPGKDIQASYLRASRRIEAGGVAALVIDDIDTTVGEWEHNSGTVNHQQVLAELMHLADRPTRIENLTEAVRRVPVFVTGNDFHKLYPPLRRAGRLWPLHWQTSAQEREEVLCGVIGTIYRDLASDMVQKYPDQPVAFFVQAAQQAQLVLGQDTLCRMHTQLALVAHDPSRFRRYLSTAGVSQDAYRRAFEDAANRLKLEEELMQKSWLQSANSTNSQS